MVDLYGRRLDKPLQAQEKADLARGALTRLGDEPEIAAYYFDAVGRFDLGESRYTAAVASFELARSNAERAWGMDHPELAIILDDLGWAYSWLGKNEAAREHLVRALRIKTDVYPLESVQRAETLGRLSMVMNVLGEVDQAIAYQQSALAIRRAAVASPDFAVTTSLSNLAPLYEDAGRHDEALRTIDESLGILGKILEGDHLRVAGNLTTRGRVLSSLGQVERARRSFSDAVAMVERLKGNQHVNLASPLEGLAQTELSQGRPSAAVPLLERALSLRLREPAEPISEAETRFLLARGLWESGKDRPRVSSLLASARLGYEASGPAGRKRLLELERWAAINGSK